MAAPEVPSQDDAERDAAIESDAARASESSAWPSGPSDDRGLPLELDWSAPIECPSSADVSAELGRIVTIEVGYRPLPLRAVGLITSREDQYHLDLRTEREGEIGERTLVAANCGDLLRATTLVLALAFGEGVALRPDPLEAPDSSPLAPEVAPQLSPDEEPPPVVAPPSTIRFAVGLVLGATAGLLPNPLFEGGITGELGEPWWRVRLHLAGTSSAGIDIDSLTHASFASLGGTLEGCAGAPVEALRGEVCGGVVSTGIYAEASGTSDDKSVWAPLVGLRLALGLGWITDSLEPRLSASVIWNTTRPRFDIAGEGTVHRVDELRVGGSVALAWSP